MPKRLDDAAKDCSINSLMRLFTRHSKKDFNYQPSDEYQRMKHQESMNELRLEKWNRKRTTHAVTNT